MTNCKVSNANDTTETNGLTVKETLTRFLRSSHTLERNTLANCPLPPWWIIRRFKDFDDDDDRSQVQIQNVYELQNQIIQNPNSRQRRESRKQQNVTSNNMSRSVTNIADAYEL